MDNVSEAKDDVGKDGSQSDNNDSKEEEEHKSLDNVSEAKDPKDHFDNGERNKRCLEEETSKDFKKKKTIDLYEYKVTGNQVQIFKNGHEVINPREKLRCEALEGVQDILK